MKMVFCSLGSGSSGNVSFVQAGDTRLLVDAGLSGKAITEALKEIEVLPEMLNGILVTHEHIDHIKGVGILSRKYHIPVYANEATWEKMYTVVGEIQPGLRRVFQSEEDFYIGDMGVLPFHISHDAAEPVAYKLFGGRCSIAVATDMGKVSKKNLNFLSQTDLVLLESNHDPDMLWQNDRYSAALKRRISGDRGHLSNRSCAETLLKLYETGVHHALLGHLSQDNNTPELALHTVKEILTQNGLDTQTEMQLDMTWRNRVGGKYTLE